MKETFKKSISFLLAFVMVVGVFSSMTTFVFAAGVDYNHNASISTDEYYNLISKSNWDNAPGISESEIVLNNDAGDYRQVIHIMKADVTNEYVNVIPTYSEMNTSKYQTGTMLDQANWIDQNMEGEVIGTMNCCLSWYTGYSAERVGEPLGFMMMNSEIMFDPGNCGYNYGNVGFPTCVVINKDINDEGEERPLEIPKLEMVQICTSEDLDGWEETVIPISSGYIVKDGINQSQASHKNDPAPRSVVGITADNQVVIMENDGRQSPFSAGMNMYECAEVMIAAGCVWAANCDGGGSSTFVSQRPGEELKVNNSPSDGGLRPSTSGICFISTAPADGTFVRANVEAENQYYTPNSTIQFTAKGADMSGSPAEIPAEAYWKLSETSENRGSIDQNGLFTSNGTVGNVTAQLVYESKVYGEYTVNVVVPDALVFNQSTLTVPNGESTSFSVTAMYGLNEVTSKPSDYSLTLSSSKMGVLDGSVLNATSDETVTGGSIIATLTYDSSVTAIMQVVFGKASEVIYDFEEGFGDGWYVEWGYARKNTSSGNPLKAAYNIIVKDYAATKENGMVHDGNGSGAVYVDNTRATINWAGARLNWAGETVEYKNVASIGAWVYIPQDAVSYAVRFMLTGVKDGVESSIDVSPHTFGDSLYFEESGWQYVSVDVSGYDSIILKQSCDYESFLNSTGKNGFTILLSAQLNGGSSGEYDWVTTPGVKAIDTFYMDNLTIDYSNACDDREEPIFGEVAYIEPISSEDKYLNNQRQTTTVTNHSNIGFSVAVAEDNAKINATGLNEATAKAYIDGNEVACTFNGKNISVNGQNLNNGVHTIRFTICDNAGNFASVIRKINIQAENNDCGIKVVPKVDMDMAFTGSQYWIDVVASKVENIDRVTLTLDLNNVNYWLLENIEALYGFEVSYKTDVAGEKLLYLTIERTDSVESTGEAVLISIPVQTWEWKEEDYPGYLPSAGGDNDLNGNGMYDPYEIWKEYVTTNMDIIVNPLEGIVYFTDGTTEWFSGEKIKVDTEQKIGTWWGCSAANKVHFEGKSSWHLHVAGEAQDKEATCTTNGYVGRVFCVGCDCVTENDLKHVCDSNDGCGAVLDWGTTISATGHNYMVVEGVLKCTCDKVFNGVYTDGKTYINGIVIANGWTDDNCSYYIDGVKLTGSHIIDDVMCTFDENGTYLPDYKYEGFYEIENTVMYFISNNYQTGYNKIDGEYYYFHDNGMAWDGTYEIYGIKCEFDNGVFVPSETVILAGMCGDNINFVIKADGSMYLDGYGATYDYYTVGNIPWYVVDYRNTIKTVWIDKDITTIGVRTFYNIKTLKTVIFEEGSELAVIKGRAFMYCQSISEIVLPDYFQSIFGESFMNCYNLKKITIPETTKYIQDNAFTNVSNLCFYVRENSYAYDFAMNKGFVIEINNSLNPNLKQGVVLDEDGEIRYYVNGVAQYAGLIKVGNDYYYFGNNKVAKRNCYYGISKTNDLLPAGGYTFGADGKIVLPKQGIVLDEDGEIRYYIDGIAKHAGLVQDEEGNYYYFGSNGKAKRDCYYGISMTNGLLPAGGYWFDKDGKLCFYNPNLKQGIVLDEDGEIRYYIDGVAKHAGLVQDEEGNYYYFGSNGKAKRDCYYGISMTNGLLPAGGYTFDSNGRIVF